MRNKINKFTKFELKILAYITLLGLILCGFIYLDSYLTKINKYLGIISTILFVISLVLYIKLIKNMKKDKDSFKFLTKHESILNNEEKQVLDDAIKLKKIKDRYYTITGTITMIAVIIATIWFFYSLKSISKDDTKGWAIILFPIFVSFIGFIVGGISMSISMTIFLKKYKKNRNKINNTVESIKVSRKAM